MASHLAEYRNSSLGELLQAQEALQAAIDSLPDPVVVFGVAGLIFTHILENIGMTVGLMPITGIPLPFFSYGGSFMLTGCIGIGLTLRAAWEGRLAGYAEL